MTGAAWAFLVLATVCALVDWVAVAREWRALEYVAKPAATLAFLAAASTLGPVGGAARAAFLAALAVCVAGDVFLMLPRDAFVPGLASFAVAQALFVVGFATGDVDLRRIVVGAAVMVPVAALLGRRFIGALRRSDRAALVAPVAVYMVLISTMAVAAIGAGRPVAVAGAVAFMASDSLIAESRFVAPRRWHPVAIMATYHLALAGLVLGLA